MHSPWLIVTPEPQNFFITSDNPGYFIDRSGSIHNTKVFDSNEMVDIKCFHFPLSPRHSLVILPVYDSYGDFVPINPFIKMVSVLDQDPRYQDFTLQANMITAKLCNRMILGSSKETLVKVRNMLNEEKVDQ